LESFWGEDTITPIENSDGTEQPLSDNGVSTGEEE
jgi:hypothetical protein